MGPVSAGALLAGAGLCLASPALPPMPVIVLMLALGLPAWFGRWRGRWLGAGLFGFAWAALHAALALGQQLPVAQEQVEQVITGRVIGLPQHEARRTRFQLRIEVARSAHELRGRRVALSWYDDFGTTSPGPRLQVRAGERWELPVTLRAPRGLRNPGGFDSERHALVQRLAATGYVRKPFAARKLSPARGVNAWRELMSARIGQGVRVPSSRFIRAMALGDTRGLTDDDWQLLRSTGLTHLIAISGFHVGIVGAAFAALTGLLWRGAPVLGRHLPRPQAMALAAAGASLVYAAVAGFSLPTVRTVLMMSVWCLARMGRRPASVTQAVSLALAAVLIFDPLAPLSAGFWLSFAGVVWLAWSLPREEQPSWWRGFLSAQAVATVGLLPLTVVLFDQASLVGPVVNLLAIPWWSLVVVPLSLLGLLLETVWAGAGVPVWTRAATAFDWLWPVIEWLGQSHLALWWLPEAPVWALPLALLGALWLLLPRGLPGKWLALLLWWPLLWPQRQPLAPGEVELAVIDVGQGLSVLVRTANHHLLYDTGPASRDGFDAGERAVVPALRAWGIRQLDTLVLSHGDNDHAGGYGAVVAALRTRQTQVPVAMPWTGAAERCGSGHRWRWDGVEFQYLHPGSGFPYLGNESSCVLRVHSRHGTALLTGDIGEVIERTLVRQQPAALRADVVLVPHHGSAGSSDPAFVKATGARLVLVSSGHGNRFGHPRPEVVRRWQQAGAEALDTVKSGALQVWLARGGLEVRERRHAYRRLWDAEQWRLRRMPRSPRTPHAGQASKRQHPDGGGESL